MEGHCCTCILSLAYYLNRLIWLTFGILLYEHFTLTMDFSLQIVRKSVYAGYTDTMETSGNLIAVLAELTSGMKDCQHDLESRTVFLLMHSCRNTTTVILYRDGVILIDKHFNVRTVACESLINTIVHNLIYKMVETSFADITDIHRRSLSHRLKAFQNLDTICGVLLRRGVVHYFFTHYIFLLFFGFNIPIRCERWGINKRTNLRIFLITSSKYPQ